MKEVALSEIPAGELFCLKPEEITLWRVYARTIDITDALDEFGKKRSFSNSLKVWTIK